MSEMYKLFVQNKKGLRFDRKSLEEMYLYESRGIKFDFTYNGYYYGKRWMDVTVKMWNKDLKSGLLCRYELEQELPEWFLEKVLIFKGDLDSRLSKDERRHVLDHDSE